MVGDGVGLFVQLSFNLAFSWHLGSRFFENPQWSAAMQSVLNIYSQTSGS